MSKLALRRAWFQVHKWIGLILAILIIPISVTGSALVWDEALDRGINPGRYAVSGGTMIDPELYVSAARGALKPGGAILSMTMPDGEGPVIVTASQPGPSISGPPRTMIYLDPPTARVLEVTNNRSGILRAFHMIHGSLMLPAVGRQIVGWIGVAMMVSCFTGLWLWWPTVGKWVRGLRWRRHDNLDTNLHHLLGFWVALPLFVLSLTGAWISFPQFFGMIGGGGQPRGAGPDRAAMARAKPLEAPHLSLDTAVASAQAALPGDLRQVTWPTDMKPEWRIALDGDPQPSVTIDDTSGAAKIGRRPKEDTARLMRRIHDGTRMGLLWQVLIFIGGILPAILAVTGIIMWWRARVWKGELKARQRARITP
ncbi:MAG: PepSY protein [Sphingomonas bacterium]|uniref:PepSY-associated TM helix domain-containing protein n=1 Tax=Sphingomonas bacterium TaxID=1895847 RepID=UPI00260A1823|nr:PepSY-associated TM helix domain-containing protein [Sphingomonas bacterium]MDB5706407.1 PepSY protein [Sphingomonas bacterium]